MRNTVLPDLPAEWTEDEARLALDEWRRSGQTIAAFARDHQVSAPRLYWWRKRLPKNGAAPMMPLVPAKIVARPEMAAVVIRLPSGIAIEMASVAPHVIAAVVSELERSS